MNGFLFSGRVCGKAWGLPFLYLLRTHEQDPAQVVEKIFGNELVAAGAPTTFVAIAGRFNHDLCGDWSRVGALPGCCQPDHVRKSELLVSRGKGLFSRGQTGKAVPDDWPGDVLARK